MKKLIASIPIIALLASCASGSKKVIIISQGTANVNTDDRTVTATGTGHEEKTVMFYEGGSMQLKVASQNGNATVTLPENGVYLLNTKKDTIVGSFVNYTAPKTEGHRIGDAEMKANIDSLEAIVSGRVSAEKKTFFIPPNQAVKITANQDATIITPFHQMTSLEVKKGETPEVYRFYMLGETRATLEKLKNMMGEGTQPINDKPVNDKPVNDPK